MAKEGGSLSIGLLTHSVNPRGGVVHTLELATALHAKGHRVTVMAPAASRQSLFRDLPCSAELIPVTERHESTRDMVATRVDAYIKHLISRQATRRFDVLHAQDGIGGNALATLQERGLIPGFVQTVHHIDRFEDDVVNEWQRRAVVSASKVLCVSRLWCEMLQREYGVASALVHNGVNLERFSSQPQAHDREVAERLGLRAGAPLIVAVGGIEERKNTLRLLQAFVCMRASYPQAQLVVVGGASLLNHVPYVAAFHEEARAQGLQINAGGAVSITGTLPDADMPAVLRLADVVCFPSLREGFGLVVLESLACGTPVVVSRIAPFTEYLDDADVLWTDPLSPQAISQSMIAALSCRISQTPDVCLRFDWAVSADQHLQQYYDFLWEQPPRTSYGAL